MLKHSVREIFLIIFIMAAASFAAPGGAKGFENGLRKAAFAENPRTVDFAALFDVIAADGALGVPLFVRSVSDDKIEEIFPDGYLTVRAIPGKGPVDIEFSAACGPAAIGAVRPESYGEETLEIFFYRKAGAVPKKSGVAVAVPRAIKLADGGGLRVWLALDAPENPYNDRKKLYAYAFGVTRGNFERRVAGLFKELRAAGIAVEPDPGPKEQATPGWKGRPVRFVEGFSGAEASRAAAFYPSTFVMPRKTGFGPGGTEEAALLAEIIAQGYLSSARDRFYSAAGAPVRRWNYECGNEDRVFLTYGPGITYSDPGACMFVFSPAVMYIAGAELADRDTFYFKPRLYGRDPLSESWHSSFNENPSQVNEKIKKKIEEFNRAGGLGTAAGRAAYIEKLDRFWLEEGLFYQSPLSCALYEKFNNEVKLPGQAPLRPFAECVITGPDPAAALAAALREKYGVSHYAGVPLEEFIFPAFPVGEYRPDGTKTDLHMRYAYLEYVLREARRPEYLALRLARERRDVYSYLRIIRKASGALGAITESRDYGISRQLRDSLRRITPGTPLYRARLKQYMWWLDPPEDKKAAALEEGPIDDRRLSAIAGEVSRAIEKACGAREIKITARYAAREDCAKYVIFEGDTLAVDFTFLSLVRFKCGMDGVYHLLAHEIASGRLTGADPFAVSAASLEFLGRKPAYEELFDALGLSKERRRAIREMARPKN